VCIARSYWFNRQCLVLRWGGACVNVSKYPKVFVLLCPQVNGPIQWVRGSAAARPCVYRVCVCLCVFVCHSLFQACVGMSTCLTVIFVSDVGSVSCARAVCIYGRRQISRNRHSRTNGKLAPSKWSPNTPTIKATTHATQTPPNSLRSIERRRT